MVIYVLTKGGERVEVPEGREARRDQLIAAGFIWTNPPKLSESAAPAEMSEAGKALRKSRAKKED